MQRFTTTTILALAIFTLVQGCASTNSTFTSGRGKPSLQNLNQASAWIQIDANVGEYRNDESGNPLAPWYIATTVSATPTFRVDAYKPLLGDAVDFKCIVQSVDISDKINAIAYGLQANEGTFELGRDYSLLTPGENFVLRKAATKNILTEAQPLPAGNYILAATITNRENNQSTVAISQFTVAP